MSNEEFMRQFNQAFFENTVELPDNIAQALDAHFRELYEPIDSEEPKG